MRMIPGMRYHAITRDGRVYSFGRYVRNGRGVKYKKGKWLSPYLGKWVGSARYMRVDMREDGVRFSRGIHQLIALTYIGPPPFEDALVLHKDDNKLNNHPDNLYYGNKSQNAKDCLRNGLRTRCADKGPKLTNEEVLTIKQNLANGIAIETIAKELGVHKKVVLRISTGECWSFLDLDGNNEN